MSTQMHITRRTLLSAAIAGTARVSYSKFILVANLAKSIPGGDFRGFQFHLWRKRGAPMTSVSRQYGRDKLAPKSPIITELKLTDDAIAEIDYCFDALKPYLKVVSPVR